MSMLWLQQKEAERPAADGDVVRHRDDRRSDDVVEQVPRAADDPLLAQSSVGAK